MDTKIPGYIVRNGVAVGLNSNITLITTTPVGVVLPFAGSGAPNGYLICDGQEISRKEYSELFKVIGTTYGEGDGSTTFNIPDYRETVLIGTGENTTDTIADHDVYELGEFKDDQSQGHWHILGNSNGTVTVSLGASIKGGSITGANSGGENRYPVDTALDAITDGTNGEPRKGTTTHGKQKGVTYIIKAYSTNEGEDVGLTDEVKNYIDTTATIPTSKPDTIEPGSIWIEA